MSKLRFLLFASILPFILISCATTSIDTKNITDASKEVYVIQEKVLDDLQSGNSDAAAVIEYQKQKMDELSALYTELEQSIAYEKAQAYAEGKAEGYKQAIEDVKSTATKETIE